MLLPDRRRQRDLVLLDASPLSLLPLPSPCACPSHAHPDAQGQADIHGPAAPLHVDQDGEGSQGASQASCRAAGLPAGSDGWLFYFFGGGGTWENVKFFFILKLNS